MALGDDPTKTYKVIDNASSTLASGISAAATIASLNTGDGALFPTTYNGTATSAGTNNTLNSTGIGASGFAVGDQIYNVTDGSWATVVTINTNDIVTTELRGGSGNTWDNSDEWVVNPFVATFVQYTTTGDATTAVVKREKVLVKYRSTDDLYIGNRGFDGTSATAFDSGDNVYVFVERATIEAMASALRQMQYETERAITKDGARYLDNNTFLKASDAAGTGTVDIIKVDGSDDAIFGVVPQNPAGRTITNNQDMIDKEYFDDNQPGSWSATFGENINGTTTPQAVYISDSTGGRNDGEVYLADSNDTSNGAVRFNGFVISNVTSGSTGNVVTGIVGGFTGLDEGTMYYVDTTAGAITTTNTGVPVGEAVSTTEIDTRKAFGQIVMVADQTTGALGATATTLTFTCGFKPRHVKIMGKMTAQSGGTGNIRQAGIYVDTDGSTISGIAVRTGDPLYAQTANIETLLDTTSYTLTDGSGSSTNVLDNITITATGIEIDFTGTSGGSETANVAVVCYG